LCGAATVVYARKLGSSTSADLLLFPHSPKQKKKQKPAFRNNLTVDFDRT